MHDLIQSQQRLLKMTLRTDIHPPSWQPPTWLTLECFAANCVEAEHRQGCLRHVAHRMAEWTASGQGPPAASSQVGSPAASSQVRLDQVGIVMATVEELKSPELMSDLRIGLFVSVLGLHNKEPEYPPGGVRRKFPILWHNGRQEALLKVLPDIVATLVSGKNVAVHCLNSFHRGPIAVAAILKALFGFKPRRTLKYISTQRKVFGPYCTDEVIDRDLGSAIRWAETLEIYAPVAQVALRPAAAASSHAAAAASSSAPAASSQGAKDRPFSVWTTPHQHATLKQKDEMLRKDKGHYLYRAMALDGHDLTTPHPASSQGLEGFGLVEAIIKAVAEGSKYRSPFMHFSWDFVQARHWYMRARTLRGEQNNYMMRVKVSELQKLASEEKARRDADLQRSASSQDRSASSQDNDPCAILGQMLDLSTPKSARVAFGKYGSSDYVVERAHKLSIAHNHLEVLVPWRGCLPKGLFELIDCDSGLPVTVTV